MAEIRERRIISSVWWFFLLSAFCLCLAGCSPKTHVTETRQPVFAVWDLDQLSMQEAGQPDLGEMLALQIAQTLKEKKGLMVVEREQLEAVLQELNIGSSELADESTRLRLGRLAGATHMIFGSYLTVASKTRFDLRLVEVETGKVEKAVEKTVDSTDLDAWFNAVDQASLELVVNF